MNLVFLAILVLLVLGAVFGLILGYASIRFKVEGNEQITTPAGSFNAVKVVRDRGEKSSRKTWIWFAPELDYMIVKIHQVPLVI